MTSELPDPNDVMVDGGSDEIVVSVIDDTPEADRGKPTSLDNVEEVTEEELASYSGGVQKRINRISFERETERRGREAAERSSNEAVSYAEKLLRENRELKRSQAQTNTAFFSQAQARNETQYASAAEEFKAAQEDGDADRILKAQQNLNATQIESTRFNKQATDAARARQTAVEAEPEITVADQMPIAAPQMDSNQVQWMQRNDWFMKDGEEDMTSFAYGLHQRMVSQGVNPATDPNYYPTIDKRMREVFPDRFNEGSTSAQGEVITTTIADTARPAPATVVAPAVRTAPSGKSRTVSLTSSQVDLAERLGITKEQYAEQLLKEMN
jgi:hypothetical protein